MRNKSGGSVTAVTEARTVGEVDILGAGSLEATPAVVLVSRVQPTTAANHTQLSLHCVGRQKAEINIMARTKAIKTD